MVVADPVGHDLAGAAYLHAVVDEVAVVRVAPRGHRHRRYARGLPVVGRAALPRGADAVGLDQAEPQRVGPHRARPVARDEGEGVAAHEPRLHGELLQLPEVVEPGRVARPSVVGPQAELPQGRVAPGGGLLVGHAERGGVHAGPRDHSRPHDVGAHGADGARGHRRRHVEHAAALPEGQVVVVDVARRAARPGREALEAAPRPARAGVRVAGRGARGRRGHGRGGGGRAAGHGGPAAPLVAVLCHAPPYQSLR